MANSEIVPFFVPWITEEDKNAVLKALSSRWLTGGPKVREFERMFAQYIGVKHAIATSSCTTALHLVMRALDIKQGDEVVVPVLTFAATANAPIFCGAKPVFADVDEKTLNISPMDVLNRITNRTKAIIIVHYGGQPCDMNEILEVARDHRLFVVEDCAHALGATYYNKKVGSIGIAGAFSFYPTKSITTLEGGMITTNDDEIAKKAKLVREHGMTKNALEREREARWFYDVVDLGYNDRMSDVQAALGISQLKRIEEINRRRITVAQHYNEGLSKIGGIVIPYVAENRTHVYHLYVARVIKGEYGLSRDELYSALSRNNIGLGVHYTPLHLLTYYKENFKPGNFPIAEHVYKEILSLPIFPTMSREEVYYVVSKIKEKTSFSSNP